MSGGRRPRSPELPDRVSITVLNGWDLMPRHLHESCDPYVVLRYGKDKRATRLSHGVNPQWNESFIYDIDRHRRDIRIECYSVRNGIQDQSSEYEDLGRYDLDLSRYLDFLPAEKEVKLKYGCVKIRITDPNADKYSSYRRAYDEPLPYRSYHQTSSYESTRPSQPHFRQISRSETVPDYGDRDRRISQRDLPSSQQDNPRFHDIRNETRDRSELYQSAPLLPRSSSSYHSIPETNSAQISRSQILIPPTRSSPAPSHTLPTTPPTIPQTSFPPTEKTDASPTLDVQDLPPRYPSPEPPPTLFSANPFHPQSAHEFSLLTNELIGFSQLKSLSYSHRMDVKHCQRRKSEILGFLTNTDLIVASMRLERTESVLKEMESEDS
ncbi:hypothetical protein BLNAU_326 [Blattamonas nauphoetae]|uniref:C2 domain-containing protein n=1 Tax=Blattamonas nauphoetae TaxID=2049346 RepID=A0ABQ9YKX4_9EUKA|nr:hypothetical protein BLNAU_326 [Blattamonas nauphoetae]